MAHQGSFSSVAAVQLRDVWYHSQCRLQEEKNTIRRQEKRKISDTPPPFFSASGYGCVGLLNRQA